MYSAIERSRQFQLQHQLIRRVKIHISLANLNPNKAIVLTCPVIGDTYKKVTGEVLTADEMNAHNTFEKADKVKPAAFNGILTKNGVLTVTMPAKSVVVLELTK